MATQTTTAILNHAMAVAFCLKDLDRSKTIAVLQPFRTEYALSEDWVDGFTTAFRSLCDGDTAAELIEQCSILGERR